MAGVKLLGPLLGVAVGVCCWGFAVGAAVDSTADAQALNTKKEVSFYDDKLRDHGMCIATLHERANALTALTMQ